MSWHKVMIMARIDMKRLFKSRDYWIPMALLSGIFFVIMPFVLLSMITGITGSNIVEQVGGVLNALPGPSRTTCKVTPRRRRPPTPLRSICWPRLRSSFR